MEEGGGGGCLPKKHSKAKLCCLVTVLLVVVVGLVGVLMWAFSGCSCSKEGPKTWLPGDYAVGDIGLAIAHADNQTFSFQQLKFLDSEDYAMQPMCWAGGEEGTVVISLNGECATAKISEDKKTISGGPGMLADNPLRWITPEEAKIIRTREKEPVSAPKVPYPLRPGQLGRLVFLSGPPGSGKSTIAGIIAKNEKWVFYEGDGFFLGFNPYVFPNESQVEARSEKPALIGPGMAARGGALVGFLINQYQMSQNETTHRGPTDYYYKLMAENIKSERERVGGDWIVAFALKKRLDRDIFREVLGPELLSIVLDISLELVIERLQGRGEGEDALAAEHWQHQPAGKDEPRTIGFEIIKSRSKQENAAAVLELIKKN